MKRLIIAVTFILLAVLLAVGGYFVLKNTGETLCTLLSEVETAAEAKDTETAKEKIKAVSDYWDKRHGFVQALVDHSETDELELQLRLLKKSAESEDSAEWIEICREAVSRCEHMTNSEKLLFGNLF